MRYTNNCLIICMIDQLFPKITRDLKTVSYFQTVVFHSNRGFVKIYVVPTYIHV